MKDSKRHPINALTALKVRTEKKPGRYTDGNGLYLVIDPSGARRWLLRLVIQGKRRDLGLGSATLVSLAEAREQALAYRKIARRGGDPIDQKLRTAPKPTFSTVAEAAHKERAPTFRNAKHAAQWISTLRTYAFPVIGRMSVDTIGTPDILRLIRPIWQSKPETARRVLQRIAVVMDAAKADGHRTGDNPVNAVKQGLSKQVGVKQHHRAMPFAEVPSFVTKLRTDDGFALSHLPLEYLILTACRTSEVLRATWDEIDFSRAVWTIPKSRMKANREHRVPLAQRCLEILKQAREHSPLSDFVFTGRDGVSAASNMTLVQVMRRDNLAYVPHGFRSSFRDWASETTSYPREVCEMALAHTISNKVEAAYRRGDLFNKRWALMEDWATYVSTGLNKLHGT